MDRFPPGTSARKWLERDLFMLEVGSRFATKPVFSVGGQPNGRTRAPLSR